MAKINQQIVYVKITPDGEIIQETGKITKYEQSDFEGVIAVIAMKDRFKRVYCDFRNKNVQILKSSQNAEFHGWALPDFANQLVVKILSNKENNLRQNIEDARNALINAEVALGLFQELSEKVKSKM